MPVPPVKHDTQCLKSMPQIPSPRLLLLIWKYSGICWAAKRKVKNYEKLLYVPGQEVPSGYWPLYFSYIATQFLWCICSQTCTPMRFLNSISLFHKWQKQLSRREAWYDKAIILFQSYKQTDCSQNQEEGPQNCQPTFLANNSNCILSNCNLILFNCSLILSNFLVSLFNCNLILPNCHRILLACNLILSNCSLILSLYFAVRL